MPEKIQATRLSASERACLFKLEQQMVRQQGFIDRQSFIDELDEVLSQWELNGHIELDDKELQHLPQEQVEQQHLTHSYHLSGELWIASACLRRIYACDL